MGEYAEYALASAMRRGWRVDPNYVPRKRPRTECPCCGKSVEASEGLNAHMKAKHKAEWLALKEAEQP